MSAFSDQRGFSLAELLASMAAGIVVLTAIMMMTTVATHNQDRIARRVAANQRVRPVMTRLIDELHSACVAPRVQPVLTGSNDTSISFLSKSGSTVSPTPDLRVVSLTGTTLSESVYASTGGTPPSWTFSGTASSTTTLLTNVSAPGGDAFRYYDYLNGALNPTALTTPLSTTSAARTAYVTIALTAGPQVTSTQDPNSPITVFDSAALRLESASPVASQDNLPCQ
jgi:Tfp pilus assembly protein PilW